MNSDDQAIVARSQAEAANQELAQAKARISSLESDIVHANNIHRIAVEAAEFNATNLAAAKEKLSIAVNALRYCARHGSPRAKKALDDMGLLDK